MASIDRPGDLQQAVGQRGLTLINMSNNEEIADVRLIGNRLVVSLVEYIEWAQDLVLEARDKQFGFLEP